MPNYGYEAKDQSGKVVRGVIPNAASADEAAQKLFESGLQPISLSIRFRFDNVADKKVHGSFFDGFKRSVSNPELQSLFRQMRSNQQAGISVFSSLEKLKAQPENPYLQEILESVYGALVDGKGLAQAFGEHPDVFSEITVSLIKVGEASGKLESAFSNICTYLSGNYRLEKEIKGMFRMPAIHAAMAVGVAIFSTYWTLPALQRSYSGKTIELSSTSKALIEVVGVLSTWGPFVGLGLAISLFAAYAYTRTPTGLLRYHEKLLSMPLVGNLIRQTIVSRWCRLVAVTLDAGIPMPQALTLAGSAVGNRWVAQCSAQMKGLLEEGVAMSDVAMSFGSLFTPSDIQKIETGVLNGRVVEQFENIAESYEQEIPFALSKLHDRTKTLLQIAVGAIVGFVCFAVLVPIMLNPINQIFSFGY